MNQYAKISSISNFGLNAYKLDVETHIANGLPNFKIIGLPDKTISEAKERVSSAIKSSGFSFPLKRITVNLGPSEIPKHGTNFDLAIACSILIASNQVNQTNKNYFLCGELGLDGSVRANPVLSILINQMNTTKNIIVSNKFEAIRNSNKSILTVANLIDCCDYISGKKELKKLSPNKNTNSKTKLLPNLQISESIARFITISIGGKHHSNLTGIPGCGKTVLAKLMSDLQPETTNKENIELDQIYSLTKYQKPSRAPFRDPHHTSTLISIIGGGTIPRPGEISLAHKGILFLDEIPLFNTKILNSLRYPLDFQNICISRNSIKTTLPADFQLISAMNPCPCGYLDSNIKECKCSPSKVFNYLQKVPEPLWDRIDIHFTLDPKNIITLKQNKSSNLSNKIQEDINLIRLKQQKRGIENSKLELRDVKKICKITRSAEDFINLITRKSKLTTRSIIKITRLAQTISDLENHEKITKADIAESISYRNRKDYLLEN